MLKNIKKITWFFLSLFTLVGLLSLSIIVHASDAYDFSNFSESDSMAFVESCNIEIPENLLGSDDLASFTRSIILQSYNTPNIPFCFNYWGTQQYAEELRSAVRSHMNLANLPSAVSITPRTVASYCLTA